MERPQSASVLDQVRVRGQYERLPTNTAHLAAELSVPQDVARLTRDFDDGSTPLRDVGRMFTAQRTAILESYQAGTIGNMVTTHPEILFIPVKNLHERVVSGNQDQPIGHNFFVNAAGFLDARLPWARQFNELLQRRTGASIYDIAESNDSAGKDRLLAAITKNPDEELMITLAVYLAGRSLEGEKYLKQHYGEVLEHAKGNVYATTQSIGSTTGLRIDMLERAAGQLQRVTFGSFDHLKGLVTSDNSGAAGDYQIGSLRVEIQFDGSVRSARLRSDSDAYYVVAHELHHAGSAQTQENYRCGLQINGEGLEANEGMTEYLAQLSIGSPGIERVTDGLRIRQDVPYRVPVFAMLELHEQFKAGKNNHFAVLFNAYHGDVRGQAQLEQALDAFYRQDVAISGQLSK
ncbi:hypothetical protein H6801_04315 [Candidatus Nomurabacteria bacterium]|jgi:hypothetical protein|nr:hypothetical protein [Candidatus Saccharibacteria bacterium]MCA9312760.1 hypothetical protein [Candidatus Saccharibacteria bacterium]MCB9822556.1 hypothetical protein [Candidatus Nomurabacteria bacterium]